MFECFACSRRFKKVQALRGHLRHCEYHRRRRQNAQAEAEAGNQPLGQPQPEHNPSRGRARSRLVQGDDAKPLSRRPGRDSQDSLRLLLDVSEVFPQLKQECLDSAAIARLWATVYSDITSKEEWVELYWILDDCERDYEQMVLRFRLDPVLLSSIYRHMLAVKKRWLGYRIHDLSRSTRPGSGMEGDTGPEELDDKYALALRDQEVMWDKIMANIKNMLVASL